MFVKPLIAFILLALVALPFSALLTVCGPVLLGGSYTMGGGLAIGGSGTCLDIQANDVSIDCGGNTISAGIFTTSTGIKSANSNTQINNCVLSGFSTDVKLTGASGARISNIRGGSDYGLVLNASSNGAYENLSFDNIAVYGIWADNQSNFNNFTNISINNTGVGWGIYNQKSDNNTYDCLGGVINGSNQTTTLGIAVIQNVNNTVVKNCQISSYSAGIYSETGKNLTAFNNTINLTFASRLNLGVGRGSGTPWFGNALSADGQRTVTGSYGGKIWTSSNFGFSFQEQAASPTKAWVYFASSSSGQVLLASHESSSDYPYLSKDYGVTWTAQTGTSASLQYGVGASYNGSYLIVSIPADYVYTSSDMGANWVQQTSLGTGYYSAAMSASGQRMIVAKYSGSGMQYSNDYGNSWTAVSSPPSAVATLAMSNNGTYVLAGTDPTGSGELFRSTDGGATFSAISSLPSGAGTSWYGIDMSADGKTMVACRYAHDKYISYDYGVNWINVTAGQTDRLWVGCGLSDDAAVWVTSTFDYPLGTINTSSNFSNAIDLYDSIGANVSNNTIVSKNMSALAVESLSTNNSFVYNNITSRFWAIDSTNKTNNTLNISNAGNIYYFANSTPSWYFYNLTCTLTCPWADGGTFWPFNYTLGEWAGLIFDAHPFMNGSAPAPGGVYIGPVGGPYNWTWVTYSVTNVIKRGGPYNWTWSTYSPGDGVLVPNGTTEKNWSWIPE